jgi:chlorophyllide a reductase subunit Y
MRAAAEAAGKSEVLDRYAQDYPQGPHDKPQSMCPAFGSLRVGLRMRARRPCCAARPAASTA